MAKSIVLCAAFLALLGSGCVATKPTTERKQAAWENVSAGVSRYDCPAAVCGYRIIIYRFDKGAYSWRFAKSSEPKTVESWMTDGADAAFVMNGPFFDEKLEPTGALVMNGKNIGNNEYDAAKSGTVELSPRQRVIDTANEKAAIGEMKEAAQSFPMIIRDGTPIDAYKDSRGARRTMIGDDKDGNIYAVFMPEDAVTFAGSAKSLAATGVAWRNVLNLDGGTSTGFAARFGNWTETMNSIVQVPIVIIAEKI